MCGLPDYLSVRGCPFFYIEPQCCSRGIGNTLPPGAGGGGRFLIFFFFVVKVIIRIMLLYVQTGELVNRDVGVCVCVCVCVCAHACESLSKVFI